RAARDRRLDVRPRHRRLHGAGIGDVLHALADRSWILFARRTFHRSMRRLFCVVLVACNHASAPATVSLALPLPTAPVTPVSEKREPAYAREMDFQSDQGQIHLV